MGTAKPTEIQVTLEHGVGGGALRFRRMRGRERLAQPFEFTLDLLSDATSISTKDLLGAGVSVSLEAVGGQREFNGIVTRVKIDDYGLNDGGVKRVTYRAIVRPRLWLLTRGSHCRFFHDRTVLEIVETLLNDYSVDYRSECTAHYERLDHCAQYRETDFDFFSRLLEREGIYYFFEHTGGKDVLVLADAPTAHKPLPNYGAISFQPWLTDDAPLIESIGEWTFEDELVAGTSEVNAFDFKNVSSSEHQGLLARATSDDGRRAYVLSDYSLDYHAQGDGHRYAQAHIEAHQALAACAEGRASARGMRAGGTFALTGHPRRDQNREYLVVDVDYTLGRADDPASGDTQSAAEPIFECRFTVIPKSRAYRAQRCTPRPRAGLQTALVIAPDGDELAVSAYLQVKVQFHWEQFNPPSSSERMQRSWVRVAQNWAGKNWGAVFVPRAGQEVVVAFLDGDPDRPIIVGSVYNSANETPYALPAHGAVAAIRTKAIEGSEHNELRFNDKDLQLLLYTGGRHDTYVKKKELTWIGEDQHTIVQGKQLVKVGAQHLTISGAQNIKVDASASLHAQANVIHRAGMTYALGAEIVHIKGDAQVVIEASAMLTLKVGDSFVTINPAGVQISGPIVAINSGGAAGAGPGGSPASPSEPEKADDGSSIK